MTAPVISTKQWDLGSLVGITRETVMQDREAKTLWNHISGEAL